MTVKSYTRKSASDRVKAFQWKQSDGEVKPYVEKRDDGSFFFNGFGGVPESIQDGDWVVIDENNTPKRLSDADFKRDHDEEQSSDQTT